MWCGKTDYTAKLKVFRVKVLRLAIYALAYLDEIKNLILFYKLLILVGDGFTLKALPT